MSENELPRKFRRLFVGLYYSLCACFVALVAYGATYGAFFDNATLNDTPNASVTTAHISLLRCNDELKRLQDRLNSKATEQFKQLLKAVDGDEWSKWSRGWRRSLESLRRQCRTLPKNEFRVFKKRRNGLARLHVAIDNSFDSFGRRGRKAIDAIESR